MGESWCQWVRNGELALGLFHFPESLFQGKSKCDFFAFLLSATMNEN